MLICETCKKSFDMKTQTKFNIFRACKESKICEDCYASLPYHLTKSDYFNIFDSESLKPYLVKNPVTLENMSRKYSRAEAEERFRIYCEKQRVKNTYEFKKQKYGWTVEQFKEYNKRRSITLENCIKKHGVEKGTLIFNDYCEKQKEAGVSLSFFIDKYGIEKGTEKFKEVCKNKALTEENFKRKYGVGQGLQKFNEYLERKNTNINFRSKKADDIFKKLLKIDSGKISCLENEHWIFNSDRKRFLYDYTNLSKMKIIEFNGNFWHANPELFEDENAVLYANKSVKEIRELNQAKIDCAVSAGFNVLEVWEKDFDENPEEAFNMILEFLEIRYYNA